MYTGGAVSKKRSEIQLNGDGNIGIFGIFGISNYKIIFHFIQHLFCIHYTVWKLVKVDARHGRSCTLVTRL